ncbi:murein biosynthesis integral membrane protein MurJ [Microvirga flavescens]|uniref:murein biosynthesis integral membrane protein MurJ n=1 Tax=Microvirga flavescens TaxID=2249811 RepID=UPI000DDA057D|nr:murein biosynthesis integral membrane protein MurJ [Microvirga flavescens]
MSLVRSSLLVGLGAGASRILGFARDVLFAQALGAGPVADAFLAAFRLPNLVRRVVGEGGLNPALIPALGRMEPEEAAPFAGDVMSVFALAVTGLTGLVIFAAGLVSFLLAPGLSSEDTLGLVALYTRLGFPSVIGVTLASIGAALLNWHRRFTAATMAPLVVNSALIAMLIALPLIGDVPLRTKAAWLAVAATLAGLVQLAIVALALTKGEPRPIRFRKPRWTPALRGILLAVFPALVASGAVQLFILAATQVASFWPSGVSWLYYAERVMQLPLGLMGALGASVLLPELALRHRAGEHEAIIAAQNKAMELALLLALPAATALAILAHPIASVLFERGAFSPQDADGTAAVLVGLSAALPLAALSKVLSQTLFARGSLRGTLIATLAGLVATFVAAWGLGRLFGISGIALGVAVGCATHVAMLAFLLAIVGLWRPDRALGLRIVKIALASLVLALGLFLAMKALPEPGLFALALLCVGGFVLYAVAALMLGAVTRDEIAQLMRKS